MYYSKIFSHSFSLITLVSLITASYAATSNPSPTQNSASAWIQKWSQPGWTKDDVSTFLDYLTDNTAGHPHIGDFKFFKNNKNSDFSLIATVDDSGRDFFNSVYIVKKDNNNFTTQEIDTQDLQSLDNVINDLNGDGNTELIIPKSITSYVSGDVPVASWPAVYVNASGKWVEQSSSYPMFYTQKIIPDLQQKLANLKNSTPKPNTSKYAADILQIELNKALKVSGMPSSDALNFGLSLANDPDPVRRKFAISVLSDVTDPSSVTALEKLASDSDSAVAAVAKTHLFSKLTKSPSGIYDKLFSIQKGKVTELVDTFDALIFKNANYNMKITNGEPTDCKKDHDNDRDDKVTRACYKKTVESAKIILNGKEILHHGRLEESKHKGVITISGVNVQSHNIMKVELRGKVGAQIRITLIPVSAPISGSKSK